MQPTNTSVDDYLAGVTPAKRRAEAERLVSLVAEATGEKPVMWGSIVGFGSYHYRYASGREGDAPAAAFAARKAAMTVYLDDMDGHAEQLARLGAHTSSVSCLYIKDLDAVDMDILLELVVSSYRAAIAGEYAAGTVVHTNKTT